MTPKLSQPYYTMQHSFFISSSPLNANLNQAFDAINHCIISKTTVKQIFIFNDAAHLFKEPALKNDWLALLKRSQSDVIICSKAIKHADLVSSLLPDFISIAGMASFVESINNQVHVASFGAFDCIDITKDIEQSIKNTQHGIHQTCNLVLTYNMQANQIQAAVDMANVLLVFGYKVNFVVKDHIENTIEQANYIDAQLLDSAYFIALSAEKPASTIAKSNSFEQITYLTISPKKWSKDSDAKSTTLTF